MLTAIRASGVSDRNDVIDAAKLVDVPPGDGLVCGLNVCDAGADRQRQIEFIPNEVNHAAAAFTPSWTFKKQRNLPHTRLLFRAESIGTSTVLHDKFVTSVGCGERFVAFCPILAARADLPALSGGGRNCPASATASTRVALP